jgi:alkyl hydroperoxide reductase subunit AhpC
MKTEKLKIKKYVNDEVMSVISSLIQSTDSTSLIFGGALRDYFLNGKSFQVSTDIDFVFTCPTSILEKELNKLTETSSFEIQKLYKNKFNGFRVVLPTHPIDIWCIESTWAFEKKLISHNSNYLQILKTTFLNWDSVLLNLNEDTLYHHDAWRHEIDNRLLNIELPQNPNLKNSLLKIERMISQHQAIPTTKTIEFINQVLSLT